jgi:methylglutaconyl-CoA hydratase
MSTIIIQKNGPIVRLSLNRPEVRNAFNDELIAELSLALKKIAKDESVRVVVLAGEGDFFCAGADLNWMKSFVGASRKQNETDARRLANLLKILNECPKPTIAQVHGAAIGGGVGLLAACDIVVAREGTVFALAEVKLGLIPATISPYVLPRMGSSAARRYFLTGERFGAETALRFGLVHEVITADRFATVVDEIARHLLSSGPKAVTEAKILIQKVGEFPGKAIVDATVLKIASLRSSPEAQEGMKAFLEKRKPGWHAT